MIHHPWNWWNLAKKKSHPSLVIETHGTNMVGFINLGWCTQDALKEYSTAAKSKLGFLLVKHLIEVILMAGILEKDINHPTESCHLTLPPEKQKSFPHQKNTEKQPGVSESSVGWWNHPPIFSPWEKKSNSSKKLRNVRLGSCLARSRSQLSVEELLSLATFFSMQIWGQGVPPLETSEKQKTVVGVAQKSWVWRVKNTQEFEL